MHHIQKVAAFCKTATLFGKIFFIISTFRKRVNFSSSKVWAFPALPAHIFQGWKRIIKIPRPSRGFFIDGYNPLLLAYTSRRVSTICQPRRFCYLLPVNGFRNFPSSTVLQLCPHLAGDGYTLLFSLHFCLPYPHSILGTKIPDFGTYIATLDTSHKSLGCFFLSDIP